GKNEIFASFSSKVDKVEYVKRDTPSDNDTCHGLNFSDVLSDDAKVFGFYDPLNPLENNSPVVEFIKNIKIDYLNYIVDINKLENNKIIQQELNDLRSNFNSKELQVNLLVLESPNLITEKVKNYGLDGVNIIYTCNVSIDNIVINITTVHSDNWNPSWITTFTVTASESELDTISRVQEYVNYTIIQAFYLGPNVDYSASPDKVNSYNGTVNSLFKRLNGMDFKKLIWGFGLSGIIKANPGSITGLMKNNDTCAGGFYIWPWKEIRNTALTDMCIAKNAEGWTRNFDTNSSTLQNNKVPVDLFAYEDLESLYHKFKWVTNNKFAGISIANLAFDS
ncbi:10457_t:CDS:2, partial [Diversispora eburnea]